MGLEGWSENMGGAAIWLASSRFDKVQLPVIHLENIYINVGDRLERPLASDLIPWTHSGQFLHNATSKPVIMALFAPFSAQEIATPPLTPDQFRISVSCALFLLSCPFLLVTTHNHLVLPPALRESARVCVKLAVLYVCARPCVFLGLPDFMSPRSRDTT